MSKPKWFKEKTTRERSDKQETSLANKFKANKTINSGATFGENDVVSADVSIEAKITYGKGYRLTVEEWRKLESRTKVTQMPSFVIEFENDDLELAVIKLSDLEAIVNKFKTEK